MYPTWSQWMRFRWLAGNQPSEVHCPILLIFFVHAIYGFLRILCDVLL